MRIFICLIKLTGRLVGGGLLLSWIVKIPLIS